MHGACRLQEARARSRYLVITPTRCASSARSRSSVSSGARRTTTCAHHPYLHPARPPCLPPATCVLPAPLPATLPATRHLHAKTCFLYVTWLSPLGAARAHEDVVAGGALPPRQHRLARRGRPVRGHQTPRLLRRGGARPGAALDLLWRCLLWRYLLWSYSLRLYSLWLHSLCLHSPWLYSPWQALLVKLGGASQGVPEQAYTDRFPEKATTMPI